MNGYHLATGTTGGVRAFLNVIFIHHLFTRIHSNAILILHVTSSFHNFSFAIQIDKLTGYLKGADLAETFSVAGIETIRHSSIGCYVNIVVPYLLYCLIKSFFQE